MGKPQPTTWMMTLIKQCWNNGSQKKPDQRTHTVWCHLHAIYKWLQVIYDIKEQASGCLGSKLEWLEVHRKGASGVLLTFWFFFSLVVVTLLCSLCDNSSSYPILFGFFFCFLKTFYWTIVDFLFAHVSVHRWESTDF